MSSTKYVFLPMFSVPPSATKSACVQVYPISGLINQHIANVWFPEDADWYVSMNDTDLSDDELIAKACYAMLAKTSVVR